MTGVWVLLALLVFATFAWTICSLECERRGDKINELLRDQRQADKFAIKQARRANEYKARIADLELTIAAMATQAENQLGEPVYDQLAVARLRKELVEFNFGGSA